MTPQQASELLDGDFKTDDDCAEWVTDIKYAQYLSGITRRHNRIVRRLVSSSEVVE